ncbi:protein Jade-1 isoform X1 [Epinephelus fuscoguttatus]|uniref:protein Jade-1 isoform X1 n=1 Tax=Epinephelus fuscoguttatus TaxID=293821 RepID=UPI0020D194DC|nr:protein Jade-1 isoform X1 [Epinephelus fuscoguttatus]
MESEKKRRKYSTSSNDSDTTDSQVTSWSRSSKNTGTSSTWVRHQHKKPSEVFRTDFITAMKLPDSAQLGPDDFYVLSDPWRQEWEKGVQVPANLEAIPEPVVRLLPTESTGSLSNNRPEMESSTQPPPSQRYSCYDLDDLDVAWLELVNHEFRQMALPELDELTMECVLVELESVCDEKMRQAIETEEGLGIEYDEDVVCDVCRSPEGEDGNEMVFCDKCNVCVHQACYGILKVPQGNWLCRTCALGVQPKCLLCPKRGGALKPTRSGTKWVHVSCALWIPEVSIGCPEKMEPITKVSHIPASRWALSCSLCREHTGTCIQCSMPSCIVAFHVTCAFDHGLEMRTILAENDEVRFKSFCLEHSCTASNSSATNNNFSSLTSVSNGNHTTTSTTNGAHSTARPDWATTGANSELRPDQQHQPNNSGDPEQRSVLYPISVSTSERAERDQLEREKVSQRKQKLQELEDEFYQLVDPMEVAENLALPVSQVDFLYQFWKMKRKANFNRPLVTLKRDEVDNLAQQEQDVLYRRLKLFTHLRQDLERVRNLCYMVTRREKMKHTLCDLQEKIFHLQIQLLEEDIAGEKTQKGEKRKQNGVKEKGKERRKSSPEKKKERLKPENGSLLKELGLSKSFPLDNSLFDSWLAQSVQITADDMLSQWALGAQHRDKSGSLLSDQLLQGEESLLNLMMENSMQSTWKTPQLGRKPRGGNKPRARGHPQPTTPTLPQTVLSAAADSAASSPSTAKSLWASVAEEKPSHGGRKGERSRGSSKALHHHHLHHHQTRSSDLHRDPPPQPPISKMDSCHISEDRGPWDSVYAGNGVASGFTASSSPRPASSPGATLPDTGAITRGGGARLRLSRQGKSRGRGVSGGGGIAGLESVSLPLTAKDTSLLDAAETDGYFSDGEQSDSDTRSGGRKLRLPQLHSGNEDLLRRSVLAS